MTFNEKDEASIGIIASNIAWMYSFKMVDLQKIKAAVKEIDSSKKKLQNIMDLKAKGENELTVKNDKSNVPIDAQTDQLNKQTEALKKQINTEKTKNKSLNTQTISETPGTKSASSGISNSASSLNNNQQILELYSQGKSVLEISKLLDLGQGEVKLVIDLFKGKK
jgi:DNA-binding NarL/FixJ family response regulator